MAGAGEETRAPSGWYEDPTGRHELRFWDGDAWTEHVADSGTASTDPLQTAPVRPVDRVVDEASGSTALHLACSHGDLEQVRSLLSQHANVNALNKWGSTPLDLTYSNGQDLRYRGVYSQIARLLEARGARAVKWSGPTF